MGQLKYRRKEDRTASPTHLQNESRKNIPRGFRHQKETSAVEVAEVRASENRLQRRMV